MCVCVCPDVLRTGGYHGLFELLIYPTQVQSLNQKQFFIFTKKRVENRKNVHENSLDLNIKMSWEPAVIWSVWADNYPTQVQSLNQKQFLIFKKKELKIEKMFMKIPYT
jgi:hypothetical protein